MLDKFGSPENEPLSEDYRNGYRAGLAAARGCVRRTLTGNCLNIERQNDPDVSSWHMLLATDTAIQETKVPK